MAPLHRAHLKVPSSSLVLGRVRSKFRKGCILPAQTFPGAQVTSLQTLQVTSRIIGAFRITTFETTECSCLVLTMIEDGGRESCAWLYLLTDLTL